MVYQTWRERAHLFINGMNLPPEMTAKERKALFRRRGKEFHGMTSWGRKAWGRAVREHIHRIEGGSPPPHVPTIDQAIAGRNDIIFPFRNADG